MKTEIFCDENYSTEFEKTVLPFCCEHETDGYYSSFDKKEMHYISFLNENAVANILILHGFTECAEKFIEPAYYFYNEGYNVYIPDLRGHGLSFKDEAPKYAVHSEGFDIYAKDISVFIKNIVSENGLPVYAFTHSLGGNVALLTLMSDPDISIEKLVLSSPMICGNMGMPVPVAKAVSSLVCAVGKGKMPAPGKCVFEPEKGNPDAASKERGDFDLEFKKEYEAFQTCGPTMAWVKHSIEARDEILKEKNVRKLNVKLLLIKPETDRQLLESYQDKFISLCEENGKEISVIQTENTCHEIFRSRKNELEKYYESIIDFFA